MGSLSDQDSMQEAAKALSDFGIPYESHVTSAHRTPSRTEKLVHDCEANGVEVFIAGAGGAAHLAGVVAARTLVPVIGVPLDSSPLRGIDALLSTAQMPPGVPVASMGIGRWGARNAGILAVQILSLSRPPLREALAKHRKTMEEGVEEADGKLKKGA
ncbi:MAG: 5-(carboxyamino)imidazole ribonucleotide mutase [Nitrospirae bacterium]|nr:5-(carboxyamino)imidazole ribonucleotide mutase [Nitrospirota bacterium]